jgi:hypothetical protein
MTHKTLELTIPCRRSATIRYALVLLLLAACTPSSQEFRAPAVAPAVHAAADDNIDDPRVRRLASLSDNFWLFTNHGIYSLSSAVPGEPDFGPPAQVWPRRQ